MFGSNVGKGDRVVHIVGPGRFFKFHTCFTGRVCGATTRTLSAYAMMRFPFPMLVGLLRGDCGVKCCFVGCLDIRVKGSSSHAIGLARGRVHTHLTRTLLFLRSSCKLTGSKIALSYDLDHRSLTGVSGVAADGYVHALSTFMSRNLVRAGIEGVGVLGRRRVGGVTGKWGPLRGHR